ncbi:MAG: 16S rRNA (guanine(527)-N(7))-methyltransferase RsmG [Ruminococcaceae bacterium]|nr:16S rRNA (guanine(527)-N(7))-methyltransferase RsmG [Oscillospiraceae bacterium]
MPHFNFNPFLEYAEKNNIQIPENTVEILTVYGNLLLEWNEKINLTAIKEPDEIVIKHFIDSLSLLKIIDPKKGERLIDVGTGAGFPGMVIKILRPDLDVTLLDGHAKRFIFLEDLQNQLGIRAENLHIRAELASKELKYREAFDYATARAVARLNTLAEYCMPFVKKGGKFIAMKGPGADEELIEAKKSISILGGNNEKLIFEILPQDNTRNFIVVEKNSSTHEKYPRASAKISKSPL